MKIYHVYQWWLKNYFSMLILKLLLVQTLNAWIHWMGLELINQSLVVYNHLLWVHKILLILKAMLSNNYYSKEDSLLVLKSMIWCLLLEKILRNKQRKMTHIKCSSNSNKEEWQQLKLLIGLSSNYFSNKRKLQIFMILLRKKFIQKISN